MEARRIVVLRVGRGAVIVDVRLHPGASWEDAEWALRLLAEVYEATGPPPLPLELRVYPDQASLDAGVARAAAEAGAAAAASYEATAYEALAGVPRLHACPPCLRAHPQGRALLAHEAAHAVLHPTIDYYRVEAPAGAPAWAVYAAAAAVKDLEVNTLLARTGLDWALQGLRRYWEPLLRRAECTPQALHDALRASTAWLAERLEPPAPPCRPLRAGVEALKRLAGGPGRPWSRVAEVVEAIIGGQAKD